MDDERRIYVEGKFDPRELAVLKKWWEEAFVGPARKRNRTRQRLARWIAQFILTGCVHFPLAAWLTPPWYAGFAMAMAAWMLAGLSLSAGAPK